MKIHHLNCGSLRPHLGNVETLVYCLLVETSIGPVLIDTDFGTRDYKNPSRKMRFFLNWMGVPRDYKELTVNQVQAQGFKPKVVQNIGRL